MERTRPQSDTPEALVINQWFEDLSHYETTLEQMSTAKLDENFSEELKAIEQWFEVLSISERTSALFALLKHTTPIQVRFFATVLQQMASKDKLNNKAPTSAAPIGAGGDRAVNGNAKSSSGMLSVATTSLNHPKSSINNAIAQADWSMGPSSAPTRLLSLSPAVQSPIIAFQSAPSPQVLASPLPRTHPGDGWTHVSLADGRATSASGSARGRTPLVVIAPPANAAAAARLDADEMDDWNGFKEKGKIPDNVDLSLLNDVPGWLRSLRLHKYTGNFEGCNWREMVNMSHADLEGKGVLALGARNKLLKVFELVKAECVKEAIPV